MKVFTQRLYLSVIFILTFCLFPPFVHAQEETNALTKTNMQAAKAREEIMARFEEIAKEQMATGSEPGVIRSARGITTSFKYYTKDYVCITVDGKKKTLAELRSAMELMFKIGCQSIRPEMEILDIEVKGDTATIESKYKSIMEIRRKDGIVNTLENSGRGRDFWVKINGKWFLKRTRLIEDHNTLNGQPFP